MSTSAASSPATHPVLIATPRALIGSLFSFEALLLLYMFAGIYKADPRLAWLPVDATALFLVLSVMVGSFIIVLNPIKKKGLIIVLSMLCLVGWLLASLLWSPSRIYGSSKVLAVASMGFWAVIAGALIIAPNPERVRRLFTLLLLLTLWLGLEVMLLYAETGAGRIVLESGNYLTVGRICGLGAVIALVGWMYARGAFAWVCLGLFLLFGFVLAIGGGRGPMLATAFSLMVPVVIGVHLTKRKIFYSRTQLSVVGLLLVALGGLAAYGATTDRRLGTIERLDRLIAEDEFRGSEARRLELYAEAGRVWAAAPVIGHGAGGWTVAIGRPDERRYPHNLFLEVLVEGGLVGLAVLLVLLGTALRPVSLEHLRSDPQALCVMMLFVNTFLNAMVSGDLPDNRPLFLFLGLLAVFALRRPVTTPKASAVRGAGSIRGRQQSALIPPAAATGK